MRKGRFEGTLVVSESELQLLNNVLSGVGMIVRIVAYHGSSKEYDVQFINPYKENSIYDSTGIVQRLSQINIKNAN